ncbi:MAG: hypothetical protein M2R45_01608 [Verrucomicrobia subdivision 3 bacterium]|nr:hypothetical protein [Limisphaerales bacterium]MCS1412760.1 hypothetical protein [Limisphaerales bacterium]
MNQARVRISLRWLGAFLIFVGMERLMAQVAFNPPEGGWNYKYEGDEAAYAPDGEGFASLDGTWSHDNNSDQWDGSGIGGEFGDDNRPGGAQIITEGDATYLRIQDTGDPRDYGYSDPASNRKIYFGHDLTADGASETILDDGVTLNFRARVPTDGPLDPLHPNDQQDNGIQPYPAGGDGYVTSNGGKGNFVIKQSSGGAIAFSLTTATDTPDGNPNEFVTNFAGLSMNEFAGNEISDDVNFGQGDGANVVPFDPTQWHEFWITIEKDAANVGTHIASIYIDGDTIPQVFKMTAGSGNDFGDLSYLAMGATATPQNAALDIDFYRVKFGAVAPEGAPAGAPPNFADVSPTIGAGFVNPDDGVTFTATSDDSIPDGNIQVILNGQDLSANLEIGGTPRARTVKLTGLQANVIYDGMVVVTDSKGVSITGILSFNTFSADNRMFEAEDFNFDKGEFIDNPAVDGDNSYFDKGVLTNSEGIDFHELSDEFDFANEAAWRIPSAGNMPATAPNNNEAGRDRYVDLPENDFSVEGTQAEEWLNYTRNFSGGDSNIYLRATDSGPYVVQLDRVTSSASQPNQTTELLGLFRSEGARGEDYQWVPLTGDTGALSIVNLDGGVTLRATIVSGSPNLNFFMLTPVPSLDDGAVLAINFASEEPMEAGSKVTGAAGVLGTVNWNNLTGQDGDRAVLVADVGGTATNVGVTVSWTSNNTWASQGRGEDNNSAPDGNDRLLMTGYLDTNASDPNSVTVSGLADGATYDVIVYTKGGVIGRGGDYTIGDQTQSHIDAAAFSGSYVFGAEGDYLVFKDISGSSFTLIGQPTTGSPARAPINAVEVVIGGGVEIPTAGGITSFSVSNGALVIEYTGTLKSASDVAGPYTDVAGAVSGLPISLDAAAQFFIAE